MLNNLRSDLKDLASPEKAKILQRFFKTGKGEYGAGDLFLGIKVPEQRLLSRKYKSLPINDIETLLKSKYHEERLVALLILIQKYKVRDIEIKNEIFSFYLENTIHINNWDLVDLSAPNIVGNHLLNQKNRKILYELAYSKNLWEKRISIISTFTFIRNNDFFDTLSLSKILLNDSNDLIHKAVGWMLREIGKRDVLILKNFLEEFSKVMPRTTLRYSIEKLSHTEKIYYMKR